MVVPIANISAVVTGAVHAAKAFATEVLPAAVTMDAVVEAAMAYLAWFLLHLWAWLVAAAEASEPWLEMATKLLHELYGWLVAAGAMAVEKLPAAATAAAWFTVDALQPCLEKAWKLWQALYARLVAASALSVENLTDAAADVASGARAESTVEASGPSLPTAAHGVGVYVLLVLTFLAVAFLCGAVCALTCRTMKGPGLGGARVPRAMFAANPRRYYAAVRTARKVRRGASGAGWMLFVAAPIVACVAYLVAKTFYRDV